jgi:DeoR/GlpR family transcriptional regulator of sugar metabolism
VSISRNKEISILTRENIPGGYGNKLSLIFKDLYVEKLFLAAGGFSLEAGLTYPGFTDLPLKRAMIDSAKTVYLLVDSSKLEKVLFASLGCQDKIDFLITDGGISKEYIDKLTNINIKTIVAHSVAT